MFSRQSALNTEINFFGIEKTIVKMRRLSDHEVEDYLSSKEWMNRASGYAIGAALKFFPSILGCYSNIVGLPLTLLLRKLKASGFRYMKDRILKGKIFC